MKTRRRKIAHLLAVTFPVLIACAPSATVPVRREPPPSQAALDAIANRGRLLAQMDQVAWKCTDAVRAQGQISKRGGAYIVYRDGGSLKAAFGGRSNDGRSFLTHYEGMIKPGDSRCEIASFDPPRQDMGWVSQAHEAVQRAAKAFQGDPQVEAYNYSVVRENESETSVYFYPGTTTSDAVLGADARVSVRPDSVEVTRYHKALLKQVKPDSPEDKIRISFHTHLLDNAPNPLDVLWVMTRSTKVPEYIFGDKWMFAVMPDGRVEFAGYSDEFKKDSR